MCGPNSFIFWSMGSGWFRRPRGVTVLTTCQLLAVLRTRLTTSPTRRIPLCAMHLDLARAALPYPAYGVHLRILQCPVDQVGRSACWACQAAHEA